MAKTSSASLTPDEKAVIKTLLLQGWRSQDVQVLVNSGRKSSVNFGRFANIKSNTAIEPASDLVVKQFRTKKILFDQITGLCPFEDERLVRAREAMILAVELFNTPRIVFKAGAFSMLAIVAWTYLMHHYFAQQGVSILRDDGFTISLTQMCDRPDSPLSKGCKQNLAALKQIRDVVEHHTIGPFDKKWLPLFQSTCLNFDKYLTQFFGARVSLGHDLGFSLQFAKMTTSEISILQSFDVPEHIAALDASLMSKLKNSEADDLDYQFKVIYTLTSASKTQAHFQFVQPESAEGKEIQNVLIKYKPSGELYPLKPSEAASLIAKISGRPFTSDKHQRAWKLYKARPLNGAKKPSATDPRFCLYHAPYKSYTYSTEWANFVASEIADQAKWEKIQSFHA